MLGQIFISRIIKIFLFETQQKKRGLNIPKSYYSSLYFSISYFLNLATGVLDLVSIKT